MTLHIDWYATAGTPHGFDAMWSDECHRQMEGDEAVRYAATIGASKGLPHFNGYTMQTALHDDGECEEHRPTGRVWGDPIPWDGLLPAPVSSTSLSSNDDTPTNADVGPDRSAS